MNLALWVVAIVLAAVFVGSGLMKLLGAGLQLRQYPTDRTR
jgi:uncharacterized membrane protein YphA (DoxX/SURF4 family)